MGVLVPPPIGVDSTLIGVKSTQSVPEEFARSWGVRVVGFGPRVDLFRFLRRPALPQL